MVTASVQTRHTAYKGGTRKCYEIFIEKAFDSGRWGHQDIGE